MVTELTIWVCILDRISAVFLSLPLPLVPGLFRIMSKIPSGHHLITNERHEDPVPRLGPTGRLPRGHFLSALWHDPGRSGCR